MVKELERAGLPTVHICTIAPISQTVGANRIVPAVAIPHPLGNPVLTPKEEFILRKGLLERALAALETAIAEQTVFSDDEAPLEPPKPPTRMPLEQATEVRP
jgi:betaine reductase